MIEESIIRNEARNFINSIREPDSWDDNVPKNFILKVKNELNNFYKPETKMISHGRNI